MSPVNAMPALLIDDVDGAELLGDRVGVGKHGGAVGDVQACLVNLRADGPRVLRTVSASPISIDVADRNLCAAAGELVGQRAADT